ncbi:hypothetical protein [Caulobacter sp. NIBR2454]|uniref:hypothetical protein n=1 Tax=Caulobacter sp. NIBR2454 TaxID=3015996 RepID=UPI0022B6E5E4|nr:hypothetical protein [Caulobacter sp. NIBR2454]
MTDNSGLVGGLLDEQFTLLPGLLGGVGVNTSSNNLGLSVLPGVAGGVQATTQNALVGVDVLPGLDLGGGIDIDILPDIGGGVDIDIGGGAGGGGSGGGGSGGGGTGGGGTGGGGSGGGGTGGGGAGTGDNGSGDIDGNGDNGVENPGGSGSGGTGWLPGSNTNLDLEVAYQNITRVDAGSAKAAGDVATLTNLWNRVDAGTLSTTEAVREIMALAKDTSAVAVLSYQFFTGETPTVDGLDFLVNAIDTLNPTDLTDAYYNNFNLENRYINFAANLGLSGEGAQSFNQAYGGLTFEGAVRKAYGEIIGIAEATAAGVNAEAAIADIASRKDYFDALASARINSTTNQDLAAKAGLVGYILGEAVKANVGLYANALENFFFDLADSEAQFNVSLVAAYSNDTAWMA